MTLILTVLHVLVCMALVFVVLLQKGSGADMGAAFGGSSQSLFGARGSGDFLSKLTAGLATVFMITSLTLAFFSTRPGAGVSVMDKAAPTTQGQPSKGKEAATPAATTEPVQVPQSGPPVPAKSAPTSQSSAPTAPNPSASAPAEVAPSAPKPVPAPPEATPPKPAPKAEAPAKPAPKAEAPAKPVPPPDEAAGKKEKAEGKKAAAVP